MNWDPSQWPTDRRVRRGFVSIGGVVRRRRHQIALSQRAVERLSGVDQTVISRLENGKLYGLRWARFARIVDALGGLDDSLARAERPPWPGSTEGGPPDPVMLRSALEIELALLEEYADD
jgi:transcriptional regulator with XRE-family HTH domain